MIDVALFGAGRIGTIHAGNVAREEMFRTFNCGIGYTLIVAAADCESTIARLGKLGLGATAIGEIVPARGADRVHIA